MKFTTPPSPRLIWRYLLLEKGGSLLGRGLPYLEGRSLNRDERLTQSDPIGNAYTHQFQRTSHQSLQTFLRWIGFQMAHQFRRHSEK